MAQRKSLPVSVVPSPQGFTNQANRCVIACAAFTTHAAKAQSHTWGLCALPEFFSSCRCGFLTGQVRTLWPTWLQKRHVTLVLRGFSGHLRLLWPGLPHCEHVTVPLRGLEVSESAHSSLLCPTSPHTAQRLRRRSLDIVVFINTEKR